MDFRLPLSSAQEAWLTAQGYHVLDFVARGRSAGVWKVEKEGVVFAAKCEHRKSTRVRMLEKEVRHLRMANEQHIGPRIVEYDVDSGVLIMDFIEGLPLAHWLDRCTNPVELQHVVQQIQSQAARLDAAGLDHGQLGGKLHNVLIGTDLHPCIIDFEKASYVRAPRNQRKIQDVLLGGKTYHSKRILGLLPR